MLCFHKCHYVKKMRQTSGIDQWGAQWNQDYQDVLLGNTLQEPNRIFAKVNNYLYHKNIIVLNSIWLIIFLGSVCFVVKRRELKYQHWINIIMAFQRIIDLLVPVSITFASVSFFIWIADAPLLPSYIVFSMV